MPPPEQLQKQVVERLILKRLQQQRAKQLGIEVEEGVLLEALSNIAARNGLSLDEPGPPWRRGASAFRISARIRACRSF